MERLQKVLAHAGIASRRECEKIIAEGRVTVDGQVVREMGITVDPTRQRICCDGAPIKAEKKVYYLLNKPQGYVCTNAESSTQPRAVDLLRGLQQRVYTVGRLDEDSEGLILVTNDGELANLLTHPRYEVRKTYMVEVSGSLPPETVARLEKGVWISDGRALPSRLRVLHRHRDATRVEIVLREGMNREIRRIFAKVGHPVRWLRRIAIGNLVDPNLKTGAYRPLTLAEVRDLFALTKGGKRKEAPRSKLARIIESRYEGKE
ncbi:MAG: rRNA pseudouridine synthase [Planctomycetes bacterium]|nr:rRNA pseudouridine synthase [Planctomycetota bacterium]MBM4083566.1 rRNA pseudouridine synthase [Planctomycetota bacterium]